MPSINSVRVGKASPRALCQGRDNMTEYLSQLCFESLSPVLRFYDPVQFSVSSSVKQRYFYSYVFDRVGNNNRLLNVLLCAMLKFRK